MFECTNCKTTFIFGFFMPFWCEWQLALYMLSDFPGTKNLSQWRNIKKIKIVELGIKELISWTRRTQKNSKNQKLLTLYILSYFPGIRNLNSLNDLNSLNNLIGLNDLYSLISSKNLSFKEKYIFLMVCCFLLLEKGP